MDSAKVSVDKDAASALEMLLTTSRYSDLTITCHEFTFKVHRAVVCARSKPLAAAVDGEFKESVTREIDLSEDEPIIVDKLVSFLYTGDFDVVGTVVKHASALKRKTDSTNSLALLPTSKNSLLEVSSTTAEQHDSETDSFENAHTEDTATGPLMTLAKVYIIADTWDVPALKTLASSKYKAMATQAWNDPAFSESVRFLYSKTRENDRNIKNIAIEIAQNNLRALLDRVEFRGLLKDIGEVALDVMHLAVFMKGGLPAVEEGNANDRISDPYTHYDGYTSCFSKGRCKHCHEKQKKGKRMFFLDE